MLNLARAIDEMPQVGIDALNRIAADPSDVGTPEQIIDALWDAYSAPAGTTDWVRLRSLFYPSTGMNMVIVDDDARGNDLRILPDHDAYCEWCRGMLETSNLYEWELGRKIERTGNMARVLAAVAVGDQPGEPFGRAMENILLFWDRRRWWIVAILIDLITPTNPIPSGVFSDTLD